MRVTERETERERVRAKGDVMALSLAHEKH